MNLEVRDLAVNYSSEAHAVSGVSFTLAEGETVALVGESGSGKSTVLRAILGMLPRYAVVIGSVRLAERELLGLGERRLWAVRGRLIGHVAQDPYGSCNPLWTVGHHVREAWRGHGGQPAEGSIVDRLGSLGLVTADRWLRRRPAEWSGGMLQRADIVAATAHLPPVLLADEPTSALDAEAGEAALAVLVAQSRSLLVASHDLGLVCKHADRVLVLRAGRLVEEVRVDRGGLSVLAAKATHKHTRKLVAAVPNGIRRRQTAGPPGGVVARLTEVTLGYPPAAALVSELDLDIRAGEALGISGPSGSGKSTLLRAIAGLLRPPRGQVRLGGVDVWAGRRPRLPRPGYVMPVFQDVGTSLNPRWAIGRSVAEAAAAVPENAREGGAQNEGAGRAQHVRELLARVGLAGVDPSRLPSELSGGQRQRVALARALAGRPALIVADEPTAQLDPTVAAGVTKALREVVDAGCALVVVSHDVARLRGLADRVLRVEAGTLRPDP